MKKWLWALKYTSAKILILSSRMEAFREVNQRLQERWVGQIGPCEAINRLLTWADFRNCNIFVRKINCVVATNGGPWSEDLRWIKNGGVKEIVNEQIIQTMKFEIPNGGCTPLATRKPHRTTKHAIEKQTEWAQAAFIYCNDTKKYPMAQKKKRNKNLRSTFA